MTLGLSEFQANGWLGSWKGARRWGAILLLVPSFIEPRAFYQVLPVALSYSVVALPWHRPKPSARSHHHGSRRVVWFKTSHRPNSPPSLRLIFSWSTSELPYNRRDDSGENGYRSGRHAHCIPILGLRRFVVSLVLHTSYGTFPQHLIAWVRPCESQIRKRDNQ